MNSNFPQIFVLLIININKISINKMRIWVLTKFSEKIPTWKIFHFFHQF